MGKWTHSKNILSSIRYIVAEYNCYIFTFYIFLVGNNISSGWGEGVPLLIPVSHPTKPDPWSWSSDRVRFLGHLICFFLRWAGNLALSELPNTRLPRCELGDCPTQTDNTGWAGMVQCWLPPVTAPYHISQVTTTHQRSWGVSPVIYLRTLNFGVGNRFIALSLMWTRPCVH